MSLQQICEIHRKSYAFDDTSLKFGKQLGLALGKIYIHITWLSYAVLKIYLIVDEIRSFFLRFAIELVTKNTIYQKKGYLI